MRGMSAMSTMAIMSSSFVGSGYTQAYVPRKLYRTRVPVTENDFHKVRMAALKRSKRCLRNLGIKDGAL